MRLGLSIKIITVNVDIFALYIFSRNSRFLDMRENMYPSKITFIIAYRTSCTKNANFNTREIAHFCKFVKIYTLENIYVHSMFPVDRPGDLKRCDWRLFFFHFCNLKKKKLGSIFLPPKKKWKKKNAAALLTIILATRWTGNRLFYGQPWYSTN